MLWKVIGVLWARRTVRGYVAARRVEAWRVGWSGCAAEILALRYQAHQRCPSHRSAGPAAPTTGPARPASRPGMGQGLLPLLPQVVLLAANQDAMAPQASNKMPLAQRKLQAIAMTLR